MVLKKMEIVLNFFLLFINLQHWTKKKKWNLLKFSIYLNISTARAEQTAQVSAEAAIDALLFSSRGPQAWHT